MTTPGASSFSLLTADATAGSIRPTVSNTSPFISVRSSAPCTPAVTSRKGSRKRLTSLTERPVTMAKAPRRPLVRRASNGTRSEVCERDQALRRYQSAFRPGREKQHSQMDHQPASSPRPPLSLDLPTHGEPLRRRAEEARREPTLSSNRLPGRMPLSVSDILFMRPRRRRCRRPNAPLTARHTRRPLHPQLCSAWAGGLDRRQRRSPAAGEGIRRGERRRGIDHRGQSDHKPGLLHNSSHGQTPAFFGVLVDNRHAPGTGKVLFRLARTPHARFKSMCAARELRVARAGRESPVGGKLLAQWGSSRLT